MSEKLTMPKNVQAFVDKYGGIGSKEQDAAFWKEFRKAANAYANVQAKRICDLEHALAEARGQRDRLAEALRECREDSIELLGERDWWQHEPRGDYQQRYQETRHNVKRADTALQSLFCEALQSLSSNDQGSGAADAGLRINQTGNFPPLPASTCSPFL